LERTGHDHLHNRSICPFISLAITAYLYAALAYFAIARCRSWHTDFSSAK
jgi:hypothetical protein